MYEILKIIKKVNGYYSFYRFITVCYNNNFKFSNNILFIVDDFFTTVLQRLVNSPSIAFVLGNGNSFISYNQCLIYIDWFWLCFCFCRSLVYKKII
ncbi:MAG: hypothetical protein A2487_15410 [Candidatus Raymondbacteria bacterium RifOxyC12_full_50_8]|nr:MAG: hypothetical protein A2487_15410 [Candidatus Raymondbacteria bacterium RifOxyC12_full_50_8]